MGKEKEKKKGLSLAAIVVIVLGAVLLVAGVGYNYMLHHSLRLKSPELTAELEGSFEPKENIQSVFMGNPDEVEIINKVDLSKEGEYSVEYRYQKTSVTVPVTVKDTTPPELEVRSYMADLSQEITPECFVVSTKDLTEVQVSFDGWTDKREAGTQSIPIQAVDTSGNKTVKEAILYRIKDEQGPKIEGVTKVRTMEGKSVNLNAGITVSDNMDPKPVLETDFSKVDFKTPGTYKAIYLAKDRSGNESRVEREVVVSAIPKEPKKPSSNSAGTKPVAPSAGGNSSNDNYAPTGNKVVYLTFDDGPSVNTEKVLDVLARYNAKATFFVTGNGKKYNHLIQRAHNEGHAIGLHTYTHDYSKVYASVDAYYSDLNKISDMVNGLIGYRPDIIRFPGGSSNAVSKKYCKGIMTELVKDVIEKGYQYFDWNCSSGDAAGTNIAVSRIIKDSTSSSKQYVCVLMHDSNTKATTVEALPKIIEYYRDKGYVFGTLHSDSPVFHHNLNN